jgi:hypothetical protein
VRELFWGQVGVSGECAECSASVRTVSCNAAIQIGLQIDSCCTAPHTHTHTGLGRARRSKQANARCVCCCGHFHRRRPAHRCCVRTPVRAFAVSTQANTPTQREEGVLHHPVLPTSVVLHSAQVLLVSVEPRSTLLSTSFSPLFSFCDA